MRLMHGLAAISAGEIRLARGMLASIHREESADSLASISASLASAALDLIDGDDVEPASQFSTIASLSRTKACRGFRGCVTVLSKLPSSPPVRPPGASKVART